MKTTRLTTFLPPLIAMLPMTMLHAAIDISAPPVVDGFTAVPPVANWSTLSVGTATDAAITNAAGFDAKIIAAADAMAITTVLGSSASNPPTASTVARFNSTNTFLQTRPSGNDYILLLATAVNATGGDLNAVKIAYSYSKDTVTASETVKGLRAFWSTTGAPGSWTSISNLSADTTGTTASPEALAANIILPAPLANGANFYVLWADQNSSGTDASYHIDNFAISPGVNCTIDASVSNIVRLPGASATDPSDDQVSFSLSATGTGDLGAGWKAASGPASIVGSTGNYGAASSFTVGIAEFTSGPVSIVLEDQTTAECQDGTSVTAPSFVHVVTASNSPVITFDPSVDDAISYVPPVTTLVEPGWSGGTGAGITNSNVQRQPLPSDQSLKYFHVTTNGVTFTTDKVDINALKGALLQGSLDIAFYSTSTSALDNDADVITSRVEVALDGDFANVVPENIISANILDVPLGTAAAFSATIAASNPYIDLGTVGYPTANFTFHNLIGNLEIPAAASNPHARIVFQSVSGISNTEHLLLDNIKFRANFDPTLNAAVAGVGTWDNKGTVAAADDEWTSPINIRAYNVGASTGWTSNETPSRTGLYATANPVSFGPYLTRNPVSVQLSDGQNSAVKSGVLMLQPPAATLTATLVAGSIARVENGPGDADDQVTFNVDITGNNLGPEFTAASPLTPAVVSGAGAYPAVGTPVTITLSNVPNTDATVNVIFTDASYPVAVTVAVAVPSATAPVRVIAQKDFGGGPADVLVGATAEAPWISFAGGRQTVVTAGVDAVDSVIESEEVSISGAVAFTAKLHARDNSAGSNFDLNDKFKAELITNTGDVISLITPALDKGNGASAIVTPGVNGDPDGYINGYTGAAGTDFLDNATVYATALANYDANKVRDEFNTGGQNGAEALNAVIPLSGIVPAGYSTVKLKLYVQGVAGSESLTIEDALFTLSTTPPTGDTDGDGVSDADEAIMGTSPTDASDVLRLAQNPADATQIVFPTKAGRYYRIYTSDDAAESTHLQVWKDSGLATIVGDGGTANFNIGVLPTETRRFYRLHVMTTDGVWP